MGSNLNNQEKLLYAEEVTYKLNGNHVSKTPNKYTKKKKKEIQIYH